MRWTVRMMATLLLAVVIVIVGCDQEQTGDLSNRDLGTDDRVLVPTGMTLSDPGVSKGSAQWQKLRAPEFGVGAEAAAPAEAPSRTAEAAEPEEVAALRELIADFNAAAAGEDYADLAGFVVEAQVEPVEKLVQVVPALAAKVLELNAALPAPNEAMGKAVESIALSKLFHLDVGAIKMATDTSGTGEVTGGSGGVVRFVIEGEDWYLEHPLVASAAGSIGELERGVTLLDQAIAGLKSGALAGPEAEVMVGAVLDMLVVLTPEKPLAPADAGETVGT